MNVPENVRQTLKELLPQSVLPEVSCFVFYDDHPRDERLLDVTICSVKGELKEFYQRELIDSILIENIRRITNISIIRNSQCELFYLIAAENELVFVSKKNLLRIHDRVFNVNSYKFDNTRIKILLNDDAVPLVYDENLNKLDHFGIHTNDSGVNLPIVNELQRKLVEVRYNNDHNENLLKEVIKLRQLAAFQLYKRIESKNSIFNLDKNEIAKALKVQTQAPTVKICNKKIVILFSIQNENDMPLENICVLLHGTTLRVIEYTTKNYKRIKISPFWEETNPKLEAIEECTVATAVDLKELQYNVTRRIDFDLVLSLSLNGKNYLVPLEGVSISAKDVMGDNFDILAPDQDTNNLLLCTFVTSEKIDLRLRHIRNAGEITLIPMDIFCEYLQMERLLHINNIAVYKKPHKILYGLMIIVETNLTGPDHVINIQAYARSQSQILALIHSMYDVVPHKIIVTTKDYKIMAKIDTLSEYNERLEAPEGIESSCSNEIDYESDSEVMIVDD